MKKAVLILPLLLAAGAGAWYWQQRHTERGPEDRLVLYGNIDVRLTDLAFEVSGRIDSLAVNEGARVHPGEELARLDSESLRLARDAAKAKVDAQREQLRELEAGSRPEEIQKLEAQLDAARIQARNADRNYRRMRDLQHKKLASPQQADDARTAADAAAAQVRALKAELALARAGARVETIAAAKATLGALQAQLALAQYRLDQAGLRSPATAVVQSRILEVGDMASPERPVYTLALTSPLWARVYVAEPDLGKVRQGMPARVASDSFPGRSYTGWVGYISPSAEFTPKTVQTEEVRADLVYQARVFVCNPRDELRLGMPVTVTLDLNAAPVARPDCGADGASAGSAPMPARP